MVFENGLGDRFAAPFNRWQCTEDEVAEHEGK
jgi:hypothetical protein